MSSNRGEKESRIYVGNLPPDIRNKDIEDLFYKFGKVTYVDLKNRRGPPFAFVEFDDVRDATDAVKARDGYDYDGYRLRVEFPRSSGSSRHGGDRNSGSSRGDGGGSSGDRSSNRDNGRNGGTSGKWGRGAASRRSQYRVLVTG